MDHEVESDSQIVGSTNWTVASFKFPFKTASEANIVFNSLRIDKEPARGGVKKELSVEGNLLLVKISSTEVRRLRSAITSFFDFLILVVNTIACFG